jgi:hypothetical protein
MLSARRLPVSAKGRSVAADEATRGGPKVAFANCGLFHFPPFGPTPVGFSHNIVADSISIVLSQKDHLGGTSLAIARSTLLTFYRLQ